MSEVYFPSEDIFSHDDSIKDIYSVVIKNIFDKGKNLNKSRQKLIHKTQLTGLLNILDQKDTQEKILKDIISYRKKIFHALDSQTWNKYPLPENYTLDDNYFNILKDIIRTYPYILDLSTHFISIKNIDFIKDLGNNFYSLRFSHNSNSGIIIAKKDGNILKDHATILFTETNLSKYKNIYTIGLQEDGKTLGEKNIIVDIKDIPSSKKLLKELKLTYGNKQYIVDVYDEGIKII